MITSLSCTDNGTTILSERVDRYACIRNIANRSISELKDTNGDSLLIFPHSFKECDDILSEQCLFSLKEEWKDEACQSMTLQTYNLMGFVGIGDMQMSIRSRFAQSKENEDYFLHYMLQRVLSINLFSLEHFTSKESVFDFLIYLFPKFLTEALAQGLYKEYRHIEYNDSNVKGSVDLHRHIRHNIAFNGRIAYHTREFCYDNHLTQLIRHTIEYISCHKIGRMILHNNADMRTAVLQIVSATPSYNTMSRQTIMKKNIRPVRHPYFSRYTALQKLCMQILGYEGLKYGTDPNKVYGILFDGAWLWEEYLATLLTKQDFIHPQNLKGLDPIYLGQNRAYRRYPDFYRGSEKGIIVDAKYKRKIDTCNDINQMVTYMYCLKGKCGFFVLPTPELKVSEYHSLLGYGKDENAKISLYYLSIPQQVSSLKQFIKEMQQNELKFCSYINSSLDTVLIVIN